MTESSKRTIGFCEDSPFLAFTAPELSIMKKRMCQWFGRQPHQSRSAARLFRTLEEINDALSVHLDREMEEAMLQPNQDVSNPFEPHRKDFDRAEEWARELRLR